MNIIFGDHIGRRGQLRVGCGAVVRDVEGRVLLTRRADNGRWCLPGGAMEPGESVEECCVREVREETGLEVRARRLIGVYSSPNRLVEYADGNRWQIVGVWFVADVVGGSLSLSDETTAHGYFPLDEIRAMDVLEYHRTVIEDALSGREAAYMR